MHMMSTSTDARLLEKMGAFAGRLTPGERDALKFRLSLASADRLDHDFDVSSNPETRAQFFSLLRCTLATQPFRDRVPKYGMAYRGRPALMTDALVALLRAEACALRAQARENFEQFITTVDTPAETTVCERLAASAPLLQMVCEHAGPCIPSYITSYIYYDQPGQCSKPHVDNAFTALTVMIGLRHDCRAGVASSSSSIIYWPDHAPMAYRLAPGELAVFFGSGVLHGRSPVQPGEIVHSLLLSFRPIAVDASCPA